MSARMQFPLSQRRHTNIAVVRYSKNGIKLEIACYKNKVISYRSGIEDRLDEVLQVDRIFTNVGRGYIAPEKDVEAVFGKDMSEEEAIKYMLIHGELQVAQQERTAEVDEMFKDIAVIIAQKCVNSQTQRPFPSQVIEQALKSIGVGVKLDQPVKKQALGLIHQLIESQIIPIVRADMKLRCTTLSAAALDKVEAWCAENGAKVMERNDAGSDGKFKDFSALIVMQPNLFRELDILVKEELPAGSNLHMVEAAVMEVGEGDVAAMAAAGTRSSDDGANTSSRGHGTTSVSSDGVHGDSSAQESRKAAMMRQLSLNESIEDNDDAENDGRAGKKKSKKSKGGKGKRRGGHDDDDDDSDEDDSAKGMAADSTKGSNAKNEQQKQKGRGGQKGQKQADGPVSDELANQLKKLGLNPDEDFSDDDEDGHKGKGRKNKRKKGGAAGQAPASKDTKKNVKFDVSEEDSDDELMVNRKQRQKHAKKDTTQGNDYDEFDEDNFDYGEDE